MAEILQTSFIKIEPSGQEYELKDAKARQNLAELSDAIDNFDLEIDSIKKSVSDGKILLADAITLKGITTEANGSLDYINEKLSQVRAGGGYSGPYYSDYDYSNSESYGRPIYNGYPYVYVDDTYSGISNNNIAIVADYEWQNSNNWHLISQYYDISVEGSYSYFLENLFIMGLYNRDTQTGLGLCIDKDRSAFILRCYTADSKEKYTEFTIGADFIKLRSLSKIFFDLHYTYDTDEGVGYITLSYADATQHVLDWVTVFNQRITLSPKSYGAPVFLTGNELICSFSSSYAHNCLNIAECALVLDGYINWGNSSQFIFRDGEIPYELSGWQNIGGAWYYYEDGKLVIKTGWQEIKGDYYYFNEEGVMKKSTWVDGGYYWVGEDGKMATNEWIYTSDSNTYYVGADGKYVTGWQDIKGNRYYFTSDGILQKNRWIDNTYWVGEDGKMATNEWIEAASGNRYYVGADGARTIGWADIGDDRYFFNSAGVMQKNRWISNTYWVGADGKMARDEWVDNNQYYVGPDGKWDKTVVKQPLKATLTLDKTEYVYGETAILTATATGGIEPYSYEFVIKSDWGGEDGLLQEYSDINTFYWPCNSMSVTYDIQANIKDYEGTIVASNIATIIIE